MYTPAKAKVDSLRRRLQRFVAHDHPMEAFFHDWTASICREIKEKRLVLLVDETKLGDKFGVMMVALAYEKRSIPLAWRVYRANSEEGFPPEGQSAMILNLLKQVQAGIPTSKQVVVLSDRGIGTSPELMRGIMEMNWKFLFRVTKQSKIILPDGQEVTFYDQVTAPGQEYHASGTVFKKRGRIPGHVRVVWGTEAKEQWALVTNDPSLTGWEYAQRMWIEEAFRDLKSHGWQVEQALLDCPKRLSNLWILLAVTYGWMLLLGKAQEMLELTVYPKRTKDGTYVRRLSLFAEGRRAFLAHRPP